MPRFNRTGPEGQGSQTGRGLGKCNPNNKKSTEQLNEKENPEGLRRRFGRGKGNGSGAGRGMGRRLGRGNS